MATEIHHLHFLDEEDAKRINERIEYVEKEAHIERVGLKVRCKRLEEEIDCINETLSRLALRQVK